MNVRRIHGKKSAHRSVLNVLVATVIVHQIAVASSLCNNETCAASLVRPRRLSPWVACERVEVGLRSGLTGPWDWVGHFDLGKPGMTCGSTPFNLAAGNMVDEFSTVVSGTQLIVTRTDSNNAWGHYLSFTCCSPRALSYVGCYAEGTSSMLTCGPDAMDMGFTTESCRSTCAARPFFAIWNGSCCSCGNTFSHASSTGLVGGPTSDCGGFCAGEETMLPNRWCGTEFSWAVYAHGTSCSEPAGVKNVSDVGACAEGPTVEHGGHCTPQCNDKFVPSHPQLQCLSGAFYPTLTFTCIEIIGNCSAPEGIQFANYYGACVEGALLAHGGTCTSWCHPHYHPSVSSLSCHDSVLTPPTFTCLPTPCHNPVEVIMAYTTGAVLQGVSYGTCQEGNPIPHLEMCTPNCPTGHRLVMDGLINGRIQCIGGKFEPLHFACSPACEHDADCNGHGTCVTSITYGQSFCKCDYFIEPGPAWNYIALSLHENVKKVAITDGRNGQAFLLYTEEAVETRFANHPPPANAATHLVVASLESVATGLRWHYDDNLQLRPFEHQASDILIASLDLTTKNATMIVDDTLGLSTISGIRKGAWKLRGFELQLDVSGFHGHYCNPEIYDDAPPISRAASSGDPNQGFLSSLQGWAADTPHLTQWYEVDVGSVREVLSIIIKGGGSLAQWMTTFRLELSENGTSWENYPPGMDQHFVGNSDADTQVQIDFPPSLRTRYLRFFPRTYHPGWPTPGSLRVGVILCSGDPDGGELTSEGGSSLTFLDRCSRPFVVDPPADARSASSGSVAGNYSGMLDSDGWSSQISVVAGDNLWYEIDLGQVEKVRAVVMKGLASADQWTTSVGVKGSSNGIDWFPLADGLPFVGSRDRHTEAMLELGAPVDIQFVRLYPQEWTGAGPVSLRAGVVICQGPAATNEPVPAFSGAMCGAYPGNEWAIFNMFPLKSFWEVKEIKFFGDANCSWPLDVSIPISSGEALIEKSKVTRGPVYQRASNAFDGKRYTSWVSSCAFPCAAGEAYIGLRVDTPAAVRCVWLEQDGRSDRTTHAVELRVRSDVNGEWQSQTSWYGLPRTCGGGNRCALAVFSA